MRLFKMRARQLKSGRANVMDTVKSSRRDCLCLERRVGLYAVSGPGGRG